MNTRDTGALLVLDGIKKSYGNYTALNNVSLQVEAGQVLALLGPSGCGKTTLLKIIAGLLEHENGVIKVDGIDISRRPTHKRDMGMLFQNYALLPHLDAISNVRFGLEMRRLPRQEVNNRALAALDRVKMGEMAERMPRELSGGQQQRVALARAIAYEPRILLLDEPLAALDKNLRVGMQIELRRLAKQLGLTTVLVTHDQEEAMTMADRIAVMRAGNIEQIGSAREIYEHPVSRFVASFIGTSNFLEFSPHAEDQGIVIGKGATGLLLAAMQGSHVDALSRDAVLAVRPEHLTLSLTPSDDTYNVVQGTLQQLLFQGQRVTAVLRTDWGQELVATCPTKDVVEDLSEGERVWATWPAERALLLSG